MKPPATDKSGTPIWDINRAPENSTLGRFAKSITAKLAEAGISVRIGFRDGVFFFESR